MNVAQLAVALTVRTTRRHCARFLQGGVFDHAVDNPGDSFGLVADWPAFKRWRQPYPPAARGSRGCFDYQPRDWSTSGLKNAGLRPRGREPAPDF